MPITIARLTTLATAAQDTLQALQTLIQHVHKARRDYITQRRDLDDIFNDLIVDANVDTLLTDPQSPAAIQRELVLIERSAPAGQRAYQRAVTAQHRNRRALREGREPTSPAQTYRKVGQSYKVNDEVYSNEPSYDGLSPSERKVREQLRKEAADWKEPPTILPTDPDELAHMVEVLRKTEELERGEKEIEFDIPKDC